MSPESHYNLGLAIRAIEAHGQLSQMQGYIAIAGYVVMLATVWAVAMFLAFDQRFLLPGAN